MTLTVRWASLRCSWAASVLPRALFPSRSRSWHTLPGICIGSAVGAALAAFQGIDCYVPHGGFIVALATNNVALFCLDIVIGSLVAAAILIAMKPTLDKQAK